MSENQDYEKISQRSAWFYSGPRMEQWIMGVIDLKNKNHNGGPFSKSDVIKHLNDLGYSEGYSKKSIDGYFWWGRVLGLMKKIKNEYELMPSTDAISKLGGGVQLQIELATRAIKYLKPFKFMLEILMKNGPQSKSELRQKLSESFQKDKEEVKNMVKLRIPVNRFQYPQQSFTQILELGKCSGFISLAPNVSITEIGKMKFNSLIVTQSDKSVKKEISIDYFIEILRKNYPIAKQRSSIGQYTTIKQLRDLVIEVTNMDIETFNSKFIELYSNPNRTIKMQVGYGQSDGLNKEDSIYFVEITGIPAFIYYVYMEFE